MASGHSAQNSPNDQSRVTEEWEEGEEVGSKQFCCSGDDVGRQFGTFYVPLCERLSVCVCFCVCGCGLLLCRLGQVAWFTFSSRWRQILSVCVCVRIKVHTFWRQSFLFYTAVCMYVGYVSFWISLPFRKVCLYADIYANTHTQTHSHWHTRIYGANSTSCQMSRFMPTRLHINNLCSALPLCLSKPPLNILYVPECC